MGDSALHLVPEPDPDLGIQLLAMRARVATEIATGRRTDAVLEDLADELTALMPGATVLMVERDERDVARIRASNAPAAVQSRIHGQHRRHWYGAWAAVFTRRSEVVVPEVAASSLYREHRRHYVEGSLLSVRAVPLVGPHNVICGSLAVYLPEQRLLTEDELAIFDEIAQLAELAVRNEASRRELLERIRTDPLTGLENREGLEEHIRRALDAAAGRGGVVGLLFVDIDDLTLVNDSLGHTAGDTVIAMTAERIRQQLLPNDTVVRFGGDEFIVVIEQIDDLDDARRLAGRIRRAIGEPMFVDANELATTVSIGITSGGIGTNALQLVDEGHAAVVRAKQNGRGSTAVHDRVLDTGAGARLGRERRLRQALDNSEFIVYWQPKISLATGRIVGAEALVRWHDPALGLVGPDQFIGTAERAGLIGELSDWVLSHAIGEAKAFAAVDDDFSVAINMSATQLARDDILASIAEALANHDLSPRHLVIELTESVLARPSVEELLHELKGLGVRVAIDDFGTGYSSLAYVQQLPVEMVKIDRAFLHGMDESGRGAPILQAAVAMARALGLSTTVEGVETSAQLAGLRNLGVDLAQGYLFSEPNPQSTLLTLLSSGAEW